MEEVVLKTLRKPPHLISMSVYLHCSFQPLALKVVPPYTNGAVQVLQAIFTAMIFSN